MRLVLYIATSLDGYIARPDGDSDWVSAADAVVFNQKIHESGCIILGHRTFTQFAGDLYPVKGVTNIILSSDPVLSSADPNVFFAASPAAAIQKASQIGHNYVILAGGGRTNGSFLEAGLIDEIFMSVHPVILGEGIKVFGTSTKQISLERLGSQELSEGLMQIHYRVISSSPVS